MTGERPGLLFISRDLFVELQKLDVADLPECLRIMLATLCNSWAFFSEPDPKEKVLNHSSLRVEFF